MIAMPLLRLSSKDALRRVFSSIIYLSSKASPLLSSVDSAVSTYYPFLIGTFDVYIFLNNKWLDASPSFRLSRAQFSDTSLRFLKVQLEIRGENAGVLFQTHSGSR